MNGNAQYLDAADSLTGETQALPEFIAWCGALEGNQAVAIASKLAAMLPFHRVDAQMELFTSSPLIERALKGVKRSHVFAGTSKRIRPTGVVGRVVGSTVLGPVVGSERPRSIDVYRIGLLFRGAIDQNCRISVRRGTPLTLLNEGRRSITYGGTAVGVVAVAPGHQHRGYVSRTHDDASGSPYGGGARGGAVALTLELLPSYPTVPNSAPLW